jgi:Holliday junction resolvasome RuvABC endonuclease subunit
MSSIFSIDVSAASTGWCFTKDGKTFSVGTIKTLSKHSRSLRLLYFSNQLEELLLFYKPSHIVQEDTFSGKNIGTLKILSEFAGVSKYTCMKTLSIEPYILANTIVKSYFKANTKETLFYFLCEILNLENLSFKKDNDIIDAHAQLLCFADDVLNKYKYRYIKDYGYLYTEVCSE